MSWSELRPNGDKDNFDKICESICDEVEGRIQAPAEDGFSVWSCRWNVDVGIIVQIMIVIDR